VESTDLRRKSLLEAAVTFTCCSDLLFVPLILCGVQIGSVFLGVHTVAGKEVAIKLEPAIARNSPLKQESKVYKTLMGGLGVPWIMWSGRHGDYNVMVIDLLGPSLEDLFKMCNRHFTVKTVLLLADQLVSLLYYLWYCLKHGIYPSTVANTLRLKSHQCIHDAKLCRIFLFPRFLLHIIYA
jgi:casein kinase I family protein HRR25